MVWDKSLKLMVAKSENAPRNEADGRFLGRSRPKRTVDGCDIPSHHFESMGNHCLLVFARFPSSALLLFLGEGSPTKIDCRKSWYPYSNLSTKGPSLQEHRIRNQRFSSAGCLSICRMGLG